MVDRLITGKSQSRSYVALDRLITKNEVDRYLQLFLISKDGEGLSQKTLGDYYKKITRFTVRVHDKLIADITQEDIQWYLYDLKATCKPISIQGYFVTLRVWFNWLARNEYITKSPMAKMNKPRAEKHLVQPFQPGHIKDMLDLCDNSFLGTRDRAILLLFLDTGLRLSEMASIKLSDIDYGRSTIKVMGKGAKERVVAMGKTTMAALARYIVARTSRCLKFQREEPELLFMTEECGSLHPEGIYRLIKRLGKRAGLNIRCYPHKLRHTSGTYALINGASMREVQLLLGHSTDKMTREYTATIDSMFAAERHRNFSPVDRLR